MLRVKSSTERNKGQITAAEVVRQAVPDRLYRLKVCGPIAGSLYHSSG